MRKIKLASARNPDNDFINLSDLNGFFCTSFQTLGISRQLGFLPIKNRNIPVSNNPAFKRYSLTIEILAPYSEYENKYYEFLSFIDRNKQDGFRLYNLPYSKMNTRIYKDTTEGRYCLCSIEMTSKIEKRSPITLSISQDSLWIGEKQTSETSILEDEDGNLFAFSNDGEGYYSAAFKEDENVSDYFAIAFYTGVKQQADITIEGYNEVPLNIIVKGHCLNPEILLFDRNNDTIVKKFKVYEEIDEGKQLEINSSILENGIWEVDISTGEKIDLTEKVDYSFGSPYFYLNRGKYYMEVYDDGGNKPTASASWREEYSE